MICGEESHKYHISTTIDSLLTLTSTPHSSPHSQHRVLSDFNSNDLSDSPPSSPSSTFELIKVPTKDLISLSAVVFICFKPRRNLSQLHLLPATCYQ